MDRFNRLLDATYTPPSKWVLNASLSFDTDILTEEEVTEFKRLGVKITSKGKITVPKGFDTDLASVPRAAWAFIAPFDIARAAVIHDCLYRALRLGWNDCADTQKMRKAADKVFLNAMRCSEPKIAGWKIWACHRAVRIFGIFSVKP